MAKSRSEEVHVLGHIWLTRYSSLQGYFGSKFKRTHKQLITRILRRPKIDNHRLLLKSQNQISFQPSGRSWKPWFWPTTVVLGIQTLRSAYVRWLWNTNIHVKVFQHPKLVLYRTIRNTQRSKIKWICIWPRSSGGPFHFGDEFDLDDGYHDIGSSWALPLWR